MELTEMNMLVTPCIVMSVDECNKIYDKFWELAKKTNTKWNTERHLDEGIIIFRKIN